MRKLLLSGIVLTGLLFTGAASADEGKVEVLYAGSLVNLMERSVGPAFEKETGLHFQGYAAGSNLIANQIKGKLRRGDVFIGASPTASITCAIR